MDKTIKLSTQFRSMELPKESIDAEKRTVDLAFSSELPVERSFGIEILDHNPSSVDLSRLNSGGALLVDHDTRDQVGVVEVATIGADKKGRATVRFGNSQRAQEIFQDVKDGIRKLVSVGYRINKLVTDRVEKGVETLRATSWTPLEISLVSVPADPSVGIGRSATEQNEVTIENFMTTETPAAPAAPNMEVLREQASREQLSRINEINAIASRLDSRVPSIRDLANQAIKEGVSVDAFRATALGALPSVQPVAPLARVEIKDKDARRYSLARAIAAKLDGKLDGLEKELSDECALKHGRSAEGFFVPDEIMARNAIAGTGTLGGMITQIDNLGSEFISILRNRSQVLNLGARVMNLSRVTTIPRQSGAHTANWAGETVASTLSGIQLQQITLTPQAVTSYVQYSKMLLMENDPSIDNLLREDIAQQLAIAIDLAALHGTGSGQPTGIFGTTGIGSVALAANGLAIGNTTAYPALVSLESLVAAANADQGALAYLLRPSIRGVLRTTTRFASTNTPVFENEQINGYKAVVSNQIANNLTTGTATTITTPVLFGNFNDLIVANFGATDIVTDPYTAGANGVVRIYARRWADIGVRRPASFACLGGILNG